MPDQEVQQPDVDLREPSEGVDDLPRHQVKAAGAGVELDQLLDPDIAHRRHSTLAPCRSPPSSICRVRPHRCLAAAASSLPRCDEGAARPRRLAGRQPVRVHRARPRSRRILSAHQGRCLPGADDRRAVLRSPTGRCTRRSSRTSSTSTATTTAGCATSSIRRSRRGRSTATGPRCAASWRSCCPAAVGASSSPSSPSRTPRW